MSVRSKLVVFFHQLVKHSQKSCVLNRTGKNVADVLIAKRICGGEASIKSGALMVEMWNLLTSRSGHHPVD